MKRLTSQRGEITTILTIASLIFVAAGAFLGNQLTKNQALNSRAAGGTRSCGPQELKGPDTGKDCSGAAGKKVNCGMRVIADTFDVKEITDPATGKVTLVVKGNVCYTGNQTTGAHKDKLYITSEHPGKEACYKVLNPNVKTYNFSPGDIPLCDQSGQWAKLNPRLPIPPRFKEENGINSFIFTIEKPINGCIYLNTTNSGQQGGGGAGTNFDIWQDPRLCSPGGTVVPTSTLTPTPTCGSGQTCPTNTPIPSALKCNDTCTGANQCGNDSSGEKLLCTQTGYDSNGNPIHQCRQKNNLKDPTCGAPVITPHCRKPGDPTPTTGQSGDPTPTGPVIVCPPSATPTSTPSSTPILTSEPTVTPRTDLICNDTCTVGGLSCPSDHICHETTTGMRCRRINNEEDSTCKQIVNSPTPTASPVPTGGACEFWPVNFVLEQKPDGSLVPLQKLDKNIWGTLNNMMLDEVKALGKDEKQFLRDFNNTVTGGKKGFDPIAGTYDPCGGKACPIPTSLTKYCCGYPKDEIKSGATFEARNYNIVDGNTPASVKLFFDDTQYEVVKQCFNDNEYSPADDDESCTIDVSGKADKAVFDDSRLKVACGLSYRYGWVVRKKTSGPACPLDANKEACRPTNVQALIKSNNSDKARITWNYPTSCPEFRAGKDMFMIDIVDESGRVVCSKNELADPVDTITNCKIGRSAEADTIRNNGVVIDKWEEGVDYHANVWTTNIDDPISCRLGARSEDFNVPDGDDDQPVDNKSYQLDVWETGRSLGDDCYIAADREGTVNAKPSSATHCKTFRQADNKGFDTLIAEYTNNKPVNKDKTLNMKWQINRCDGPLDKGAPECNDWQNDEVFTLPWGRTARCVWVVNTNEVTCTKLKAGDTGNTGGGGSGGSGGGGSNDEDDSVPAPTVKADSQNVVSVDLKITGPIGWNSYWTPKYKSIKIQCTGGSDTELCGKTIGITSYIDNGNKYTFNAVEGVTYNLIGVVGFNSKFGDSKKSEGSIVTVKSNGGTQDKTLQVPAPIVPTVAPTRATGAIVNPFTITGEITVINRNTNIVKHIKSAKLLICANANCDGGLDQALGTRKPTVDTWDYSFRGSKDQTYFIKPVAFFEDMNGNEHLYVGKNNNFTYGGKNYRKAIQLDTDKTRYNFIINMDPVTDDGIIIACDANNDGECNTIDFVQVSQRVGLKGTDLSWDLNKDNTVNVIDVSMVLYRLGASLAN